MAVDPRVWLRAARARLGAALPRSGDRFGKERAAKRAQCRETGVRIEEGLEKYLAITPTQQRTIATLDRQEARDHGWPQSSCRPSSR